MPKFKDFSYNIPAEKPADLCVKKEALTITTDIFTEPSKIRVFRADVLTKFTILIIMLKHDIKSEGGTLVQKLICV